MRMGTQPSLGPSSREMMSLICQTSRQSMKMSQTSRQWNVMKICQTSRQTTPRARKLEVNGVAKAKQEEDVANGVAPPIKKRLNCKQTVKKGTLKAKKIEEWYPRDPHAAEASKGKPTEQKAKAKAKAKRVSKGGKPTEPKAKEDDPKAKSDAQALQVGTACRKGIKHADALILSAHGSKNTVT